VTENDTVRAISEWPVDGLTGRRKIYTAKKKVTPENVVEVLGKALAVHRMNRAEMSYLFDYYKGKQDIRLKDKIVRPEINNKVMINRANEIVVFKSAYLLDGPIRYVSNGGEDDISASVNTLNEYMRSESKDTLDKELADWMHICGIAVRMVLPDEAGEEDGSPASIYTLDPRAAFCIYHSGVGQKKVAGVLEQVDEEGQPYFCVYTPKWYFEVQNGQITKQEDRTIPYIPPYSFTPMLSRRIMPGTSKVASSVILAWSSIFFLSTTPCTSRAPLGFSVGSTSYSSIPTAVA
jgi:hypothetical protein